MATVGISAPSSIAACIAIGPWTAHCPPPEGINKFRSAPLKKEEIGSVCAVEISTKRLTTLCASPVVAIIPAIPA